MRTLFKVWTGLGRRNDVRFALLTALTLSLAASQSSQASSGPPRIVSSLDEQFVSYKVKAEAPWQTTLGLLVRAEVAKITFDRCDEGTIDWYASSPALQRQLRHFEIDNNAVDEFSYHGGFFEDLAKARRLQHFSFNRVRFTHPLAARFVGAMHGDRLQSLFFRAVLFEPTAFANILQLAEGSKLRSLSFSNCMLTASTPDGDPLKFWQMLADYLATNPAVTTLSLNFMDLSEGALPLLTKALASNTSLAALDLSYSKVGEATEHKTELTKRFPHAFTLAR